MPPAPGIFHGREKLVDNIIDMIIGHRATDRSAHVAIMGSGGMGKTSVALSVANHPRILQLFGDARHWVPCDQTPTIPLLLEHLARLLSVTVRSIDRLNDIISFLQENKVPRIILLDNFETIWDPIKTKSTSEAVLSLLGSISNITIILTMRGSVRPSGVRWTLLPPIEPLSLDAARKTFMDISTHVDDQLDELLLALDSVPLVINLIATVGQIGLMPSELLKCWQTERTALLEVSPDRLKSVDISIRVSLNSTPMLHNPDALTLLSILALLPGGIRQENLQNIAPSIPKVAAAERALLSATLAYRASNGILQVLSPIRLYMLEHHPVDAVDAQALRSFYFRLCEAGKCDPGYEGFLSTMQNLSLEERNIQSIVMNSLEHETSVDAVCAAIDYSHYLHWNTPSTAVICKAIDSIRKHPSSQLCSLMPQCLLRLGRILIRLDDYPLAISTLKEAEECSKALADWSKAGTSQVRIAEAYDQLGKHAAALSSLATAQNYFEICEDRFGKANCLQGYGRVYRLQGKYAEAATAFVEAQAIYKSLGKQAHVTQCVHYLGITYRTQGKLDEAIKCLSEAHDHYATFGPRLDATNCLYNLGIVYYSQKRYNEADIALSQAHDSYKALGNRGGMAWCRYHTGELNRRRACFDQANLSFQEAMHQNQEIRNAHGVVICLQGQARVFAAIHEVEAAKQMYCDALAAMENQGSHDEYAIVTKEIEEDMLKL
jgi:tetratricopeptide (TPR) repeat protein